MRTIAIVGAGGNAREVAGIIRDLGGFDFLGFLAGTAGQHSSPILGGFDWLGFNSVDCLAMGIGAPGIRCSLGRELAGKHPQIAWPTLIHPSAYVGATCKLERGVVVCVHAVATENVVLHEFSQLNFASSVGHETHVGAGSLINPGANVAGGVELGEGVLVGSGAQVLQYRKVGRGGIVGAGAVVVRDIPENTTVIGIPAVPHEKRSRN